MRFDAILVRYGGFRGVLQMNNERKAARLSPAAVLLSAFIRRRRLVASSSLLTAH